jgi:hypothetical protein
VEIGNTLQFTATVRNTTNAAVTWQVDGVSGGNATVGTISTSGLYTAPATVPNPNSVTVKAVSQADATKSASATVTITPIITVTVLPTSVTVLAGATQQFTATVASPVNTAVTWQVNGIAAGSSTVGTITTTGLYTAPPTPPLSGTVTVTAASVANPVRTGSATVTVVFSNATLNGQYAFGFNGYDANGFFLVAGSFEGDGNGGITNGLQDLNNGTGVYPNLTFTGSYSIGPDGRGSMSLADSQGGTSNLRLVMASNNEGRVIEFDTYANGTGFLEKQDPSAFMNSALTGGYAFHFDGVSATAEMSAAGRFSANGAGAMTAGVEDINDGGVVSPNVAFTGTYDVASNGRGTATVNNPDGTSQFSFYVVSARKLIFVSLDWVPAFLGIVTQQTLPSFSTASLMGDYAFLQTGYSSTEVAYTAGRFTADGLGAISGGFKDDNNTGAVTENVSFTGTYLISSNGRGTATLSNLTTPPDTTDIAFYLVSPETAFFVRTDSGPVASGSLFAQHGGPFTAASLAGSYAFGLTGFTSTGDIDFSGQFTADGAGNLAGTDDINDYGSLLPNLQLTGVYTVSPNGRGTMEMTTGGVTSNQRFYLVSPSRFVVVGINSFEVLIGGGDRQY